MPMLRELREAQGWSQEELAARSGMIQESISRWETGERIPRFDQMQAIARALSVSMDDIQLPPRRTEATPDGDTRAH